ncbi:MAG: chromate transporter [Clostridia bacterium]|nr:chromate transporter [Clostridia bacterium]
MPLLLELFLRFFYVGLFSVGGGLATLPFLKEMGETTGWFTAAQLSDMVAVSESTPGPLGINMATYVGFQTAGVPGAILAVLGEVAPALVVIVAVSHVLMKFRDSKYVAYAFYGLRAASAGLIAMSCLSVAQLTLFNKGVFAETGNPVIAFNFWGFVLAVVLFVGLRKFPKLHPIAFVAFGAAAGIGFHYLIGG